MKKFALSLFIIIPMIAFSQSTSVTTNPTIITANPSTDQEDKEPVKLSARNDRISFIAGPGASYITKTLYDNPVVNQTNSFVMINKATRIKTNLAVGIIYTPYVYDITRRVHVLDSNGRVVERNEIESAPRGRTFGIFLNPIAFNRVTETQPFFNMLDFGVGAGWRSAGGLVFLFTAEYFSVRQPRPWFIDQFKGKNIKYEINGQAQTSIDVTDNSIFTSKPAITFGFKLCYSFDVIKSFVSGAQSFVPPAPNNTSAQNSTPSTSSTTPVQNNTLPEQNHAPAPNNQPEVPNNPSAPTDTTGNTTDSSTAMRKSRQNSKSKIYFSVVNILSKTKEHYSNSVVDYSCRNTKGSIKNELLDVMIVMI